MRRSDELRSVKSGRGVTTRHADNGEMDAFSFLMVPGIGASSEEHWQSLWQRDVADARTVEQADRDRPDIETWLAMLNRTMAACRNPIVLVAHSLGCALVAHRWIPPRAIISLTDCARPGYRFEPATGRFTSRETWHDGGRQGVRGLDPRAL